ncbi:MAG TPA: aldo/keto reductase, partial [Actinoallomurus sp.]|nr:aldo/keto reductase [Actinoallomurus sp.]
TEHRTAVLDTVLAVAEEIGATAAQVAVAWLAGRAARSTTALVPVIGPRTLAQLREYLAALDLKLTTEQYDRLDRVSTADAGDTQEAIAFGGDAHRFRRHPVPVV